jgi:hypothetical protein
MAPSLAFLKTNLLERVFYFMFKSRLISQKSSFFSLQFSKQMRFSFKNLNKIGLGFSETSGYKSGITSTEAEFLDVIGTKVLRFFLTDIHSHLF